MYLIETKIFDTLHHHTKTDPNLINLSKCTIIYPQEDGNYKDDEYQHARVNSFVNLVVLATGIIISNASFTDIIQGLTLGNSINRKSTKLPGLEITFNNNRLFEPNLKEEVLVHYVSAPENGFYIFQREYHQPDGVQQYRSLEHLSKEQLIVELLASRYTRNINSYLTF